MKRFIGCAISLILISCDESNNKNNTLYESKSCGVDAPAKNEVLSVGQNFNISGWAIDEFSETSPEDVRIQITLPSGYIVKILDGKRGIERPDIAETFKNPGVMMSGFNVSVPSNSLLPGKYKIVILQNSTHYNLTCNANSNFLIKDIKKDMPIKEAPL